MLHSWQLPDRTQCREPQWLMMAFWMPMNPVCTLQYPLVIRVKITKICLGHNAFHPKNQKKKMREIYDSRSPILRTGTVWTGTKLIRISLRRLQVQIWPVTII